MSLTSVPSTCGSCVLADQPATDTDYDFYLSLQILPPVERLCESIEGTERARLAECLGTCVELEDLSGPSLRDSVDPTHAPLQASILIASGLSKRSSTTSASSTAWSHRCLTQSVSASASHCA